MTLRDITAEAVHDALRALRFDKSLAGSPLLDLASIEERARGNGLTVSQPASPHSDPSAQDGRPEGARATLLARLLDNTTWARLSVLRAPERTVARHELDAHRELDLLRTDFATGHIELEAWATLHYRYFGRGRSELKDVAAEVGVSRKTLSRRLSRGYGLLARALREQEMRARATRLGGHNLPAARTRFIGRERELADLRPLLARHRLVVLTGPGGVGKSRLATELARTFDPDYADGARLVELAAVADGESVAHAVAQALALSRTSEHSWLDALLSALRGAQLLLVLDNCEHLAKGAAELAASLLEGCPGLQILATSRIALPGVPDDAHRAVHPLPTPTAAQTEDADPRALLHIDAVRLFVDRAGAAAPGFRTDEESATSVSRICHRLEGIPLALELAAARLRHLPLAELERGLAHRFRLLRGDGRAARPGHESLRAALDGSYELLSEPDQRLLRRLSVFRGGCTADDAVAVCADETVPANEVEAGLTRLVTASLLERQDTRETGGPSVAGDPGDLGAGTASPVRYRLLETVREHAAGKRSALGETEALCARHMRHFTARVVAWSDEPAGAELATTFPQLDTDYPNVRRALVWAAEAAHVEAALAAASALGPWWDMRGLASDGRALLERLLAVAPEDLDPRRRAPALSTHAELLRLQGEHEASIEAATEALRLARAVSDRRTVARSQAVLGRIYAVTGPLTEARTWAARSLRSHRDLGSVNEEAEAHRDLGMIATRETRFDEARAHFAACVERARAAGNERLVGTGLNGMGVIGRYSGDGPEAIRRFESALAVARTVGDQRLQSVALHNLAATAADLEERDRARSYLAEALALARAMGDRPGEAETLHSLALSTPDPDAQHERLEASVALAREIDHAALLVIALNSLGRAVLNTGDLDRARALLEEGVTLGERVPERRHLARLHSNLCEVAARQGRLAEAREHLAQAFDHQRATTDLPALAEFLPYVARIALELERPRRAARLMGAVAAVYRHAGAERARHHADRHVGTESLVRERLGEAAAERERATGAALDFEAALALALDAVSSRPCSLPGVDE